MELDTEVLIVGAGPTGLMLACQLLRFGISFKIIDQQKDRTHESRAFGIQAKSMEIFQNLGIVDKFLAKAIKVSNILFFVNGKPILKLDKINLDNTPYPTIYFLPQSETEQILIEFIENHHLSIERQTSLETFTQNNNEVNAVLKNEITQEKRNISCSYLVGCDGAHSIVRHTLDIPFRGKEFTQQFFLADVKIGFPNKLESNFMLFFDSKGLFLHAPLNKKMSRIIGADTKTKDLKQNILSSKYLQEVAKAITHMDVEVSSVSWLSEFTLHSRTVLSYQKGRAFLAGDAAHIHSPVGAQGMNTGLQDTTNLAWKLNLVLRTKASADLLNSYQLERKYVGDTLSKTTDRFFGLLTSRNKFLSMMRSLVLTVLMTLVSKFERIQKKLFWFMSQLGIQYQTNKFVYEIVQHTDTQFSKGPKAGYRAPDVPLTNTTLFELLRNYPFNILIFQSEKCVDFLKPELITQLEKFYDNLIKLHFFKLSNNYKLIFKQYGISVCGIYFIRPDGYIGFRTNELDLNELRDYLDILFGKKFKFFDQ